MRTRIAGTKEGGELRQNRAGFRDLVNAGLRRTTVVPVLVPCIVFLVTSSAMCASSITVLDANVVLSPLQLDYEAGYVEDTAPGGIEVQVTTDNVAGVIIYVRSDDASPEVAFADLLVKCPTAGTSMGSYTSVSGTDQALWSTSTTVTGYSVFTDVRIQNLWVYPDAAGGGATLHTDALTYTVVEQ
ncbi:MAG: hypothetical protein KAW17_11740 [Candidatus Eisenbacteria sp.]|nr:hypothetical protein [Candidatus Eisenbacteria bacterium]